MSYEGVGRRRVPWVFERTRIHRARLGPDLLPSTALKVVPMAGAWLPGVERVPAVIDGGLLAGGAPRVVWHTTESDPRSEAALGWSRQAGEIGALVHLVWNPLTGEMVQKIPATRAGGTLLHREGGPEPQREGRVCLQIEVVGFAEYPFTEGPMHGLATILRWLDSWGVARQWPAGTPPGKPCYRDQARDRARWCLGGHFGHSQVPASTQADPGPIDTVKLLT